MSLRHVRAGAQAPCVACQALGREQPHGMRVEHRCARRPASTDAPRVVVVADVQECSDAWSPGSSWLVTVRYHDGSLHTLLVGGDGLPLHYDGLAGMRAPARAEVAAYELVFAERAPELLAALDGPAALMPAGH